MEDYDPVEVVAPAAPSAVPAVELSERRIGFIQVGVKREPDMFEHSVRPG